MRERRILRLFFVLDSFLFYCFWVGLVVCFGVLILQLFLCCLEDTRWSFGAQELMTDMYCSSGASCNDDICVKYDTYGA